MLLFLHPTARLLIWLLLAVFLQASHFPFLLVTGTILLLLGQSVRTQWWRLFRRTRLLLATLFLVFAYGMPGSPFLGTSWLPSQEGIHEGALHTLRLIILLGSLSWLLAPLGHQTLMGGLWYLLRPLQKVGLPTDKSVVRLTLVLEYLEKMPKQQWRQWLTAQPVDGEPTTVIIAIPPWSTRDTLSLLAFTLLLPLGVLAWQG
ncbi:MAG: hypothetical protein ACRDD3_11900 [Azovibrio sp.]